MAFIQNGVLEDDDLMVIGIVDFNHRRYGRKKLNHLLFKKSLVFLGQFDLAY